MIAIKSKNELARMRESGRIVATVLQAVAALVRPGVTLLELDAAAEKGTLAEGAVPAFKGYKGFPFTLCTSVNEQVVHGMPTNRVLAEGDIVSLDFGVKYEGYYGDSAVSLPVGKVSEEAERLMAITRDSLYAGIAAAKVGATVRDIARAVETTVRPHRYGIVREFVGHGIGQSLHEDPNIPNYEQGAARIALKSGMTVAIEPMITQGRPAIRVLEDGWTAVTADRSLAAHFEHTIAITEEGTEVLTEWTSGLLGVFAGHTATRSGAEATGR